MFNLEKVDETSQKTKTPVELSPQSNKSNNNLPKTKKEFLQKYKQDMVGAMKTQKRQNKETLEQRRVVDLKQSKSPDKSAELNSVDEKKELSLEGDSILHVNKQTYFDKSGGLSKEQMPAIKTAAKQQRVKGFTG